MHFPCKQRAQAKGNVFAFTSQSLKNVRVCALTMVTEQGTWFSGAISTRRRSINFPRHLVHNKITRMKVFPGLRVEAMSSYFGSLAMPTAACLTVTQRHTHAMHRLRSSLLGRVAFFGDLCVQMLSISVTWLARVVSSAPTVRKKNKRAIDAKSAADGRYLADSTLALAKTLGRPWKVSPRRPEGIQHANHKLMRRHGLHDETFVLYVADVGVGSELNLFQREKLHLQNRRGAGDRRGVICELAFNTAIPKFRIHEVTPKQPSEVSIALRYHGMNNCVSWNLVSIPSSSLSYSGWRRGRGRSESNAENINHPGWRFPKLVSHRATKNAGRGRTFSAGRGLTFGAGRACKRVDHHEPKSVPSTPRKPHSIIYL